MGREVHWDWFAHLPKAIEQACPSSVFLVFRFCSSRPANVCITSVPRMDRVPSSGWTGFRAVSLMPDVPGQPKQKREEGLKLSDRTKCMNPWGADSFLFGSKESSQAWSSPAQSYPVPSLSSCYVCLAWLNASQRAGQEPQALPVSCTRLF